MTEEEWLFYEVKQLAEAYTKLVRKEYEKRIERLKKENKKLRAENKALKEE